MQFLQIASLTQLVHKIAPGFCIARSGYNVSGKSYRNCRCNMHYDHIQDANCSFWIARNVQNRSMLGPISPSIIHHTGSSWKLPPWTYAPWSAKDEMLSFLQVVMFDQCNYRNHSTMMSTREKMSQRNQYNQYLNVNIEPRVFRYQHFKKRLSHLQGTMAARFSAGRLAAEWD